MLIDMFALVRPFEHGLTTGSPLHFGTFSVMVSSDGFMDYVVELIDNMSKKTADHLRTNPLVIAHCIGAMKIITAISIAKESHVILIFASYLSLIM